MIRRIKGVTVQTVLNDRPVTVVFRSPYRWRIYENDRDVTKEFGHKLRGDPIERHTPEWDNFHKIVAANTVQQRLRVER